jgi:dinuclear metal center YbgI/SA1388 family protein
MAASLDSIVRYCDTLLKTDAIQDYPVAKNGLQVANSGRVTRIAATVDAGEATLRMAADAGADFLLVHHGLFWSDITPLTGASYRKLKTALDADLAVYSSHLPLDFHSRFGNNALMARALGLSKTKPFLKSKGQFIGCRAEVNLRRNELMRRLTKVLGAKPKLIAGGPAAVRRVGLVTGGAGSHLEAAAREGVDTFITGEGPHHTFTLAHELGINLIYGGHYATETFGVKALGAHLGKKYRVPFVWLDCPSGL